MAIVAFVAFMWLLWLLWLSCGFCAPCSKYPLFLGYDADPLLKKVVFTMETQVFNKTQTRTSGYLE